MGNYDDSIFTDRRNNVRKEPAQSSKEFWDQVIGDFRNKHPEAVGPSVYNVDENGNGVVDEKVLRDYNEQKSAVRDQVTKDRQKINSTDVYIPNSKNGDTRRRTANARKNSVGSKKPVKMSSKKAVPKENLEGIKGKFKKAILYISAAAIMTGAVIGYNVNNFVDEMHVFDYLEQYSDIITNGIGHNYDANDTYWYKTDVLGRAIANAKEPEIALYAFYKTNDYQVLSAMNEILTCATSINPEVFKGATSFDDYLKIINCTNKEGSADFNRYDEYMQHMVLAAREVGTANVTNSVKDTK